MLCLKYYHALFSPCNPCISVHLNLLQICPFTCPPFFMTSSGSASVGSSDMCKTDEAKGSHRQCQVIAAESRWHSGEITNLKYTAVATAKQEFTNLNLLSFSSVCQAVQTGPSACGHSASRGVLPPTGCTMKGFGPCRSMRPSHTSILEGETRRSTALTCVTQTSVFSSVRRRLRCSK